MCRLANAVHFSYSLVIKPWSFSSNAFIENSYQYSKLFTSKYAFEDCKFQNTEH